MANGIIMKKRGELKNDRNKRYQNFKRGVQKVEKLKKGTE